MKTTGVGLVGESLELAVRFSWWLISVALVFTLLGCGYGVPLAGPTAIRIQSTFDSETQEKIWTHFEDLNARTDKKYLLREASGAPTRIDVEMVDELKPLPDTHKEIALNVKQDATIAGRATLYGDHCLIQISKFVVQGADTGLFKSVLWHEIGHCAGLKHENTQAEVMSTITLTWSAYTPEAISRFVAEFSEAAAGTTAF